MGKWFSHFFLLASFFLACYVIYSFFEIGYGVNATSISDGKLQKVKDSRDFGLTKLRISEESLKNKPISVYYVPHPDDEVLTYGVPIRNDLNAGKVVYLILFTHGEGSAVITKLNKMVAPKKVTPREIGTSRVREFLYAADALGVDSSHRDIYDPDKKDFKVNLVKQVALYFESLSTDVTHNGMSQLDVLQEHSLTGRVVNELLEEGKIKKKRTFASLYMSRLSKDKMKGEKITLVNPNDDQFINSAIMVYNRWDPENGWYACGYNSVSQQFDSLSKAKYSILTPK